MTVVRPYVFDALFYLLILVISVDFAVSGFLLLNGKNASRVPKLLGYLIIRRVEGSVDKTGRRSKMAAAFFDLRVIGFSMFCGGLLLLIASSALLFGMFF